MNPTLVDLVAGVLNVSPEHLTDESGPKTVPEWDSLAHVTIASAAEQTYGVEFTMPDILGIATLGDLKKLLTDRGVAIS